MKDGFHTTSSSFLFPPSCSLFPEDLNHFGTRSSKHASTPGDGRPGGNGVCRSLVDGTQSRRRAAGARRGHLAAGRGGQVAADRRPLRRHNQSADPAGRPAPGDCCVRPTMYGRWTWSRSLSQRDIHPPLYFIILHGLGALGIQRLELLRLFGTLMFVVSAWIAHRWIWPDASPVGKWLGTAWLLITPEMLNIATELRQYSLVYLGVMISIAALIAWWQQATPVRHALMLLALAPVVLLYAQFGTIVWVAFGLIAALLPLLAGQARRWKLLSCSIAGAIVVLLPLLLWGFQISRTRGDTTHFPLKDIYGQAFQPLCRGLTDSWCLVPWGWRSTVLPPIIALLFLAAAGWLAWQRRWQIDRVLWLAASAWGVTWLLLLAYGRIPSHAIEPKQLAPLTLIPICLLVRTTTAAAPAGARRVAVGVPGGLADRLDSGNLPDAVVVGRSHPAGSPARGGLPHRGCTQKRLFASAGREDEAAGPGSDCHAGNGPCPLGSHGGSAPRGTPDRRGHRIALGSATAAGCRGAV